MVTVPGVGRHATTVQTYARNNGRPHATEGNAELSFLCKICLIFIQLKYCINKQLFF